MGIERGVSRVGPRSRFNRGRERGGDDATVDVLTGPRSLLLREGREGIAVECGIKVAELPSLPLLSVSCQAPSYMLEGACSQMAREGGKGGSFNHFLDLCLVSLRSRPRLLLHFHHFYSPHFPGRPTDLAYNSQSLISSRRRCQKSGRESHSSRTLARSK